MLISLAAATPTFCAATTEEEEEVVGADEDHVKRTEILQYFVEKSFVRDGFPTRLEVPKLNTKTTLANSGFADAFLRRKRRKKEEQKVAREIVHNSVRVTGSEGSFGKKPVQ